MKISKLINDLEAMKKSHGELEITILDGFNGGGEPRTINLITKRNIEQCRHDTDDIETKSGDILVMGYGFY